MAVHWSCTFGVSLNFQLDATCAVEETGAAAMCFLAGHGAKIDQKPELTRRRPFADSHAEVCIFLS